MTTGELLTVAQQAGIVLQAHGNRLHVEAPHGRVTPDLRSALAQHKAELLTLLAPGEEYVPLRGGLTLPLPALCLVLSLEEREFSITLDASGQPVVEPALALTDLDRAALHRWRWHVAAIVNYGCEVIG